MFSTLKTAYGAGYRAGYSGASFRRCPFNGPSQFLLSQAWLTGWDAGIKKYLNSWLKRNAAKRLDQGAVSV